MRVAAIDCGTNSIRLLVADVDTAGRLRDVTRQMEVVRLGEGVDATGRLSAAALNRTFAAAQRYAAVIEDTGAKRLRFVATSASRDAENAAEFIAGIRQRLAVTPEVISGTEEAALSFAGATAGVRALARPALVVDIGGGSTEFVLGTDEPGQSASVDMGCVRMTERHIRNDPPTPAEVAAIRADVDALIATAAARVDLTAAASLVGLAGTVTTVAALALDLPAYDPDAIHASRIPAGQVAAVAHRLRSMTSAQRAALPVMHPGRADVIVAGSLVLERIVAAVGLPEVVVSEHDILDGIVLSLAG